MEVLVEELQERNRLKMMEELRGFITVDHHEAVNIGVLEKAIAPGGEAQNFLRPLSFGDGLTCVVTAMLPKIEWSQRCATKMQRKI